VLQGGFMRMASCVEHKLLHLDGNLRDMCNKPNFVSISDCVFVKGLDWFSLWKWYPWVMIDVSNFQN
jgi:hypothetical protein